MHLDDLFSESLRVNSQEYLNLIKCVDQIFSKEEKGEGKLRTVGKLIHIPTAGEAIIVGDIHGDLASLKHILSETKFVERALAEHDIYLIFLGDYGDRGIYSPEVYYVILMLKEVFPEKVILLRGNHEGPEDLLAHPHDLPYHLTRRFKSNGLEIYRELSRVFKRFYTAALVENRFVMLHGGVPSEARSLEDLAFAHEKHPFENHLEEILWSDPSDDVYGKQPSPRGAGYLFGEDVTRRFLEILNVKLVISCLLYTS
ncbi:MAG: serine/threonine protein phosphatase, partial [Candidatus Bathyarchaeota archaeon]|nr:serine/threonine protein phosphatase [Candidatus Bathyarchaeota archaeon]